MCHRDFMLLFVEKGFKYVFLTWPCTFQAPHSPMGPVSNAVDSGLAVGCLWAVFCLRPASGVSLLLCGNRAGRQGGSSPFRLCDRTLSLR